MPRRPAALPRSSTAGALAALATIACALAPAARGAEAESAGAASRVRVDTTLGSFIIELDTLRAPLTTANFLGYVRRDFYAGTVFHRVIANFVAQGGGYDEKYTLRPTEPPVANESGSGLSNKRGTVGLARSDAPHSGNAQFYVNLNDNDALDPTPLRWGYAVFGRVVDGIEVVERIGHTPTGTAGPFPEHAPLEPVVIRRIEVISPAAVPPAALPPKG